MQMQQFTDHEKHEDTEWAVQEVIRILMKSNCQTLTKRLELGKEALAAFEAVVTETNEVAVLDSILQQASAQWREKKRQGHDIRIDQVSGLQM
jgi:hypothetical protein